MILDDRLDREAKELAKKQAIERAAAEKAAQDAQTAHDRKITQEAAALARADAEKKAAEDAAKAKEEAEKAAAKAKEEADKAAAKAKEEADKATAMAAAEAAAAATAAANEAAAKAAAAAAEAAAKAAEPPPPPPPPEKKQPIKFKDAVGRKFSFPFELCATWQVRQPLAPFIWFSCSNFGYRGWKSSSGRLSSILRSLDLMWPRAIMILLARMATLSSHRFGKLWSSLIGLSLCTCGQFPRSQRRTPLLLLPLRQSLPR